MGNFTFWQLVLAVIVALIALRLAWVIILLLYGFFSTLAYGIGRHSAEKRESESHVRRLYGTSYPGYQPKISDWQRKQYESVSRTCQHGVPYSQICAVCVPGAEGAVQPPVGNEQGGR